MAQVYKVLGQQRPAAAGWEDAYTVPAATSSIVSTIVITNTDTVSSTFGIRVAIAGAVAAQKQTISNDVAIDANGMVTLTLGITLATTDVIRVYSASGFINFNIFGTEITA